VIVNLAIAVETIPSETANNGKSGTVICGGTYLSAKRTIRYDPNARLVTRYFFLKTTRRVAAQDTIRSGSRVKV
jgi:hypothetical protein